jgi:Dolichyl-phosphate-mannose-protein mannosyltransferase
VAEGNTFTSINKTHRVVVLSLSFVALASTIVGRSFTALIPGPWDGQLFAYMALQWIHGHLPYVSVWDHKPPGIIALIALVFTFFPKSFTALAVAEGFFVLGCIATVYFFMRRCGATIFAAALATVATAIACNLKAYNEQGTYTEIYLLWPEAMSMFFFVKASPQFRGRWVFLAGLSAGLAALFKPVGFAPLLAQCTFVALLVLRRRLLPSDFGVSVFTNIGGTLAAWAPFAVYFAFHHALGAMVDASLIYSVRYGVSGQGSILFTFNYLMSNLQPLASLIVCAGVGFILFAEQLLKPSNHRGSALRSAPPDFWPLVLLWLFADFSGSIAGGRGFPHYFLAMIPSLCVVAGFACWYLTRRIPGLGRGKVLKSTLVALVIGPLLFPQASDLRDMLSLTVRHEPPPVRAWKMIAEELNTIRSPSDTLFIWDYLPGIYFLTGMESPTPQLFAFRIFHSPRSHRRFGDEIIRDLSDSPPTFIVDGTSDSEGPELIREDSVYRAFRHLVDSDYTQVFQAENLKLYKRRAKTAIGTG